MIAITCVKAWQRGKAENAFSQSNAPFLSLSLNAAWNIKTASHLENNNLVALLSATATSTSILDLQTTSSETNKRRKPTAMNFLHSTLDKVREWAPVSHTSTFRQNGQITPEEFVAAGDYLVYKFPTWSWADASPVSKRLSYLPEGKQFLVTRGVPCHRRLDDNFAGEAGHDETMVGDGEDFNTGAPHAPGDDEDGWLRTGGLAASQEARVRDVRTVDESGNMGEREEDEDDIPDMEDEEDDEEAIIRDPKADGADSSVPSTLPSLWPRS